MESKPEEEKYNTQRLKLESSLGIVSFFLLSLTIILKRKFNKLVIETEETEKEEFPIIAAIWTFC